MSTVRGSCLCGAVAWETTGDLEVMSHCHCSRCRKAHGAAFATYVMCPAEAFQRRGEVVRYESSPGLHRSFCGRCGSVVPDQEPWQGRVFVPVGPLDDDPGVRPMAHIFAASKAPWFEIPDSLPRFDAYPPGIDTPALADRVLPASATGTPRGSCLCGGVEFVIEGAPLRALNCHCSRCRKARSAAHASNLFVAAGDLRFTRGDHLLATYKVPTARYFTQVFCRACGSPMPRVDHERGFAVVPMGSLDDDPGVRPQRHIFAASKAPWYEIADALPQDAEFPSSL
jgi:hypothetical protein